MICAALASSAVTPPIIGVRVKPASLLAEPVDGHDLRSLRFAAGLSTAELAKKVGVSAATGHRWESGQRTRTLPTDVVKSLATALGVPVTVARAAIDRS